MENNKNTQYEWFKGPQANQESKTWKQRGKEGFKWAKILSYVALFTFSMFGCVQVITVPIDNVVGQGIEIFDNEDEVAPIISRTTFTKGLAFGPSDLDETKNDVPNIDVYFSRTEPISGLWVNKYDDKELLTNIHDHVYDTQGVKMKDAYKGVNAAIVNNADDILEGKYHDENGDEQSYTMTSSAAMDLFGKSADELNNDKIAISDNGLQVYSSAAKQFTTETTATDYIEFYVPVQTTKNSVNVSGDDIYKPVYEALKLSIDATPGTIENERDQARALMSIDFLESYFNKGLDSTLFNFLAAKTEAEAIALADDDTYLDDWSDEVSYINATQFYRTSIISEILSGAGFRFNYEDMLYTDHEGNEIEDSNDKYIESIDYNVGSMVGYLSDNTNWRPITSWGEAFSLGPFYGFFVYPIGYLTSSMINGFGDHAGWESMFTIFIVVFSIRILTFALSYKSTLAQSKMQELSGKKAIIESKYTKYEGNRQMEMRKRQEVADLYKKNDINPMASMGTMFLTMPFFLAIWRVISGIPHLKAASWLGITFSATSYQELFAGHWQYLPLIAIATLIQLISQLYPRWMNKKRDGERLNAAQKEAMKKSNKTQNITMGVLVVMTVIFSAGIQIYWVVGGLWRIIEVKVTHHIKERAKASRVK